MFVFVILTGAKDSPAFGRYYVSDVRGRSIRGKHPGLCYDFGYTTSINSHWHFDHTDGNEWLNSVGAEITAQENTRKYLSETTRVEDWNFTFPPSPPGALPTKVFDQDQTLQLNESRIELKKYAPAHTDSDISIHLTDADVLHVADTFWNGYFPFIDYSTGGSIDGMIRAANVINIAISRTGT